jgi:hypothetical protein
MTLHDDSDSNMRALFTTGVARVFSAFGRLASLYSYNSSASIITPITQLERHSLETLAELGLVNTSDLHVELKHFLDHYTPL